METFHDSELLGREAKDATPGAMEFEEAGGHRKSHKPYGAKPLISVVTVVYNGETHLEEAIQSVIGQEYSGVEYIVIDGGSTDATLDIIRKYNDKIDYWVSEKDNGIYDAMNKGIAIATGDLIGFLNSDDYYEKGALETVAEAYNAVPAQDVVIAGEWRLLFEDSRLVITVSPSFRFHNGMPISHQAIFVPKSVYEKVGYYNTSYRYASDLEMVARIYLNKIKFTFLGNVVVNFRTYGASDINYRNSVKEARSILKKYFPGRIYMAYYVLSLKYMFLSSIEKKARMLFSGKYVDCLARLYFKIKSAYSMSWRK